MAGRTLMKTLPARIAAVWIALLVFSPATAPFPTCDLGDLLGSGSRHRIPVAPSSRPTTTPDDSALLLVPPLAPAARLLRFGALAALELGGFNDTHVRLSPAGTTTLRAPSFESHQTAILRI